MLIMEQNEIGELLSKKGVMQSQEVIWNAAVMAGRCPAVEIAELQ